MAGIIQNNNYRDIDSSGFIYFQAYDNPSLSRDFLKVNYINYSNKNPEDTFQYQNVEENSLSFHYNDLVLVLIIGLFSILAFVRLTGKNYFARLFMSLRNYSYSVSFFREKNLAFVLYHNLLLGVFFISSGLVLCQVMNYFQIPLPGNNSIIRLLLAISFIMVLIFLYRIIIRFCGIIFGHYRLTAEYLFYYSNLLRALGIFYLVLSMILYFLTKSVQPVFIYFIIFISIIFYLVKTFRELNIFFSNRLSLYYLILYFCALEIIPVVLIIKVLLVFFQNGYSLKGILV